MSDSFDPDAWPSSGGSGNKGGSYARNDKSSYNDDPYDTFDFEDDASTTGGRNSQSNDDFSFNFDDFGSEPTVAPKPSPLATSRRNDQDPSRRDEGDDDPYDDDPYGDDSFSTAGPKSGAAYDNGFDDDDTGYGNGGAYDDDDYQDEYDQFDREPQSGTDNKRKLIGVAAVVFLLGAIGLGVATFLGGDDGGTATPPEQAQPQAQQPNAENNTPAPAETAAAEELPGEVGQSVNDGLAAWGRFAINGEISEVQPYFVRDGPQYGRFETEAGDIRNRAIGGPAMEMKMTDMTGTKVGDDWLVRGNVSVSRPNEKVQNFPWELRMTKQSDRSPWQILTVRQP